MIEYDIIIIGNGPAGCGAALELQNSEYKTALIFKPWQKPGKVCGDAIPGRTFKLLKEYISNEEDFISKLNSCYSINRSALILNNKMISKKWNLKAFNINREEFDQSLFNLIDKKKFTLINKKVTEIIPEDEYFIVQTDDNYQFRTRRVINASGASSIIRHKDIHQKKILCKRFYAQNVNGLYENTNYFFIDKKFPGSYFWIIPTGNNNYNIGFGYFSTDYKKIDINEAIKFFETKYSVFFKEIINKSEIRGGIIPFYSNASISYKGVLNTGDAANLASPLTGAGIDSALESGIIAARTIFESLQNNISVKNTEIKYRKRIHSQFGRKYSYEKIIIKMVYLFPSILNILFYFKRK